MSGTPKHRNTCTDYTTKRRQIDIALDYLKRISLK